MRDTSVHTECPGEKALVPTSFWDTQVTVSIEVKRFSCVCPAEILHKQFSTAFGGVYPNAGRLAPAHIFKEPRHVKYGVASIAPCPI